MGKSQAEGTAGAKALGYEDKLGELGAKRLPVWLERRIGR